MRRNLNGAVFQSHAIILARNLRHALALAYGSFIHQADQFERDPMRLRFTAMIILLLSTAASTALAQSAPAGAAPKTTSPSEIEKDASAVLPSAGTSGPSAAPTMVRDCVKEPHHCTTPPSPGDRATAAGDQQPAATEPNKNKAP